MNPDCIYRNRSDPMQTGQCNYLLMTGHCRIVGLKPREQEPQNCPRYISDGTSRKTRAAGRSWHTEAEKLYHAGYTDHEIADAVGVSYSSVQNWRRKILNVDPNPDRDAAEDIERGPEPGPRQIQLFLGVGAGSVSCRAQ